MANRTAKYARTVKGTNPQYLIEEIIRKRIYESRYWKEECFAINSEILVDKGMEIRFVGGIFGSNVQPTPFLCLLCKMLQIQPDKEIVVEFIRQSDFKYVRVLGALYLRMTGTSVDIYKYLEPLYDDYRKLRRMNRDGKFELVHVDEFIDELLTSERVADIQMPRLQKRELLEMTDELPPRISALEEDVDNLLALERELEAAKERAEQAEEVIPPESRRRKHDESHSKSHHRKDDDDNKDDDEAARRKRHRHRRSPTPEHRHRHRRASPRRSSPTSHRRSHRDDHHHDSSSRRRDDRRH